MTPYATLGGGRQPTVTLYHGDVVDVLRQLPAASVACVVTSPPYWGLRDYGTGTWEGGAAGCDHRRVGTRAERPRNGLTGGLDTSINAAEPQYAAVCGRCGRCGARRVDQQLGMEPLHDCNGAFTGVKCGACYICRMVEVFSHVQRVLRDDGTLWLNIGSSYQEKQEMGLPWRMALALQAAGWWLRSEIIWHKLNPLPESVTDRPTKAHEQVFLLTKSPHYFYDAEAVRQQTGREMSWEEYAAKTAPGATWPSGGITRYAGAHKHDGGQCHPAGRNLRSVLSLASEPYPGSHFACFPQKLVEPCILAGSSAYGVCSACGSPWRRVGERQTQAPANRRTNRPIRHLAVSAAGHGTNGTGASTLGMASIHTTTGWQPTCACPAGTVPSTILDPFVGSGTTALVALAQGRHAIGVDLNATYLDLAIQRLTPALAQLPLFGLAPRAW